MVIQMSLASNVIMPHPMTHSNYNLTLSHTYFRYLQTRLHTVIHLTGTMLLTLQISLASNVIMPHAHDILPRHTTIKHSHGTLFISPNIITYIFQTPTQIRLHTVIHLTGLMPIIHVPPSISHPHSILIF